MNESPTFFIIAGTVILILMSFSVILFVVFYQRKQLTIEIEQQKELQELENKMQRKLLENSLDVQELERRRIAKDLHDEVGAILSAAKMGFNELSKKIKGVQEYESSVTNTRSLIDESISLVRSISKDLVPRTLEGFGLIPAIDEFISKIHKATHIQFEFNNKGLNENERFKPNVELALFRVLQELTNNTIKHAEANEIKIELAYSDDSLIFNFIDNGKGFDFEQKMNDPKLGLGLRNIQSRLTVIDADLKIISDPVSGTQTKIIIKNPK